MCLLCESDRHTSPLLSLNSFYGRSSDNPTAVISLKLFHDATLSMFGDPCLGALYIQLNVLLNLCTADGSSKGYLSPRLLTALFTFSLDASLQLVGVEGMSKGKSAGTLLVHIESITQAQAKAVSDDTQKAVVASGLGSEILATRIGDISSGLTEAATSEALASGLKKVMDKLDRIIQIGDQLSQVRMDILS